MPASSRRRSPRPTVGITDVAKAADVSAATVSRVFNGSATVSPEKAAAVREAAARLGYEPYGPARALRRQRTQVWAAIVADVENPFFTAVVRGIEDRAQEVGYRLVLCNADEDPDKEAAYVSVAIAERMAGVIIAVSSATTSNVRALLDEGMPVVAIDRRPQGLEVDSVVVDNRAGARMATAHLLDVGRERIACITGPARASTATERLEGYRDALDAVGAPAGRDLVRRADFRQEGGYAAAAALLSSPRPPDALFVANNLMTLGALHALSDAGRRVPDDVAIVGFDDAPWATLIDPPLSAVAQPTYEIGRAAADLLAEPAEHPRHVVLGPELLVRGSSGENSG